MLRTRLTAVVHIALLGAIAAVCAAGAQEAAPAGSLWDMPVPGGLRGALQAAGDPAAADRGQFLLEFIRRVYSGPLAPPNRAGGTPLERLVTYLERAGARGDTRDSRGESLETLPVGLPPSLWKRVVASRDATPHDLLTAILQSRNAALLYYGVLSLDDGTRAWLAEQPELVADLASRHAASFVLAAPALRVSGGAMRVPGGASAQPSWEALTGARAGDPTAFVRALLARDSGRLAYLFGSMASLTERQIRFALQLDAPAARDRLAAAQRLLTTFERVAGGWEIEHRPFWRPAVDPALLAADLRLDGSGVPILPGTRRFWNLVFDHTAPGATALDAAIAEGSPAEFAWVCEQVFGGDGVEWSRRYRAVLFASRLNPRLSPQNALDNVVAVRAAWEYPALAATLERARVREPAVLARAARRAAQLSSIPVEPRAVRAIIQFQGSLAVLARAVSRRSLSPEQCLELVSSLSAIEPGERGDYEGALVRWLDTHMGEAGRQLDQELLRLVAGAAPAEPRFVLWEGTRYRVDIAHAEAVRVSRLLGEDARPYAASATQLVRIADAIEAATLTLDGITGHVAELSAVSPAVGWDAGGDWTGDVTARFDTVVKALAQAARAKNISGARRLARPLLVLADDLLARGLIELTYATALGQPDRAWVTAADVARRHTFHLRPALGRTDGWELPAVTTGLRAGFGVGGSLLGLDTALSDLALVRLSSKPPPRKPMLADVNRKGFVAAVTLVEPAWLADDDLERIVAAIRKGRARMTALQTTGDAVALGEELRLSPSRVSLLSWKLAHEPGRLPVFMSPGELLLSGLGAVPYDSTLHAWGAPAVSREGCLCLRLPRREPAEAVAGRWGSGLFVSTFPDLNLRLAELLAEMQMPAALLGPVLASATLDFVNTAISRDEDDRRGLTEFVQGLDRARLEQYLALLTTDGPLVPVDDAVDQLPITQARP